MPGSTILTQCLLVGSRSKSQYILPGTQGRARARGVEGMICTPEKCTSSHFPRMEKAYEELGFHKLNGL
jgi:hypothetical protein